MGSARRPELHQGPFGWVAILSLVLSHGGLWKLRNDGERSSQVDVRHVPIGLRAGPGARRAHETLPRPKGPGGGHFRLPGETHAIKTVAHSKTGKTLGGGIPANPG